MNSSSLSRNASVYYANKKSLNLGLEVYQPLSLKVTGISKPKCLRAATSRNLQTLPFPQPTNQYPSAFYLSHSPPSNAAPVDE